MSFVYRCKTLNGVAVGEWTGSFERHFNNQRMTTFLSMSPSYVCLPTHLLTPGLLVANKQTRNRDIQEDTKSNIRQTFGQMLEGHDRREEEARELPSLA